MMAGTDTAALSRSPREVVPSRSRPSVVLPATALLFGIAGTAAGAGVCSAHLAKAGLDTASVLAAVVLAAGIVLLVWGNAMLVRAMPGWWRLLAVPAALMLLWFVLLPLTVAVNAVIARPGRWDRPPRQATGSAIRMWRSAPRTACACQRGTSRRATAPPSRCCPAPGLPVPRCLGRPRCWPGTATALLVDTRGHGRSGGALQRGMEWVMYTTAGLISGAPRPMS